MEQTIKVSGMTCMHCVKAVENIINEVNGVKQVDVSLENANAHIQFENVAVEDIIAALNETQYKASL